MKSIDWLLDILYPRDVACAFCGAEAQTDNHGLCAECAKGISIFVNAPSIHEIDEYTAGLLYNNVSSYAVKRLKYNGQKYIAPYLAQFIDVGGLTDIDAVVPVPLYQRRKNQRGFNQSTLIAKALCKRYDLELDETLLKRIKNTPRQTSLGVGKRHVNLKGAFLASPNCKGLTVLLVDDVRTTGSTLEACAISLKKAGCTHVYAATACYTAEAERDGI